MALRNAKSTPETSGRHETGLLGPPSWLESWRAKTTLARTIPESARQIGRLQVKARPRGAALEIGRAGGNAAGPHERLIRVPSAAASIIYIRAKAEAGPSRATSRREELRHERGGTKVLARSARAELTCTSLGPLERQSRSLGWRAIRAAQKRLASGRAGGRTKAKLE